MVAEAELMTNQTPQFALCTHIHADVELGFTRKFVIGCCFILMSLYMLVKAVEREALTVHHKNLQDVGMFHPTW
jgi:hypothetical protein